MRHTASAANPSPYVDQENTHQPWSLFNFGNGNNPVDWCPQAVEHAAA